MYLSSKEEFKTLLESNKNKLIVYLFDKNDPRHGNLCNVIEELKTDFSEVLFKVIEYELVKDLLKVNAVPSILCYNDGEVVNVLDGCTTSMLVTFVRGWCKGKSQETTLDKIKRLLKDNPIILFMKGDKHEPFCRFSRAVVHMLNDSKIKFEGYNIFEDPELREELKRYSNWPTYPQLYVNGTLIGGHDIIKELYESNSLRNEIPAEFLN